LASITANHKATVDGRLLARTGAVTLNSNRVSAAACATGDTSPEGGSPDGGTDGGTPDGGTPEDGSDSDSPEGGSDSGSPEKSSTTTTEPAPTTSTEQAASTSSTRSGSAITGGNTTSGPATATDVLGGSVDGTGLNGPAPVATLPRTGSPIAAAVLLAGLALLLAGLALLLGVGGHPLRPATPTRRQQ
jgi:hypothetical protein